MTKVYCSASEAPITFIDGWFGGYIGIIVMDDNELRIEEGDDRRYVKFTFCQWDDNYSRWVTLEQSPQFPTHVIFEFQSACQDAGRWVLDLCKLHKGRFYYAGAPEERKAEPKYELDEEDEDVQEDEDSTQGRINAIHRKTARIIHLMKGLRNDSIRVAERVDSVAMFIENALADNDLYTVDSLLAARVPDFSADRCRIDRAILRCSSRARSKLSWWTYLRDQVVEVLDEAQEETVFLMRGLLD